MYLLMYLLGFGVGFVDPGADRCAVGEGHIDLDAAVSGAFEFVDLAPVFVETVTAQHGDGDGLTVGVDGEPGVTLGRAKSDVVEPATDGAVGPIARNVSNQPVVFFAGFECPVGSKAFDQRLPV